MVKCKACGGVFQPVQADGTQYFHACPPLSAAELDAAVTGGKVVLPNGETVSDAISRRIYERANKRDENLVSTLAKDAGTMKSAGAGTQLAAAAAVAVVVV